MQFNFHELQKKYRSKKKDCDENEQNEQLIMKEETKLNPLVVEHCQRIKADFEMYHNNNRYFYLHEDKEAIKTVEKLKNDEFHNIRKQYQSKLVNVSTISKEKNRAESKKKLTKAEKEERFRHYAYLFRKNIKIIIDKLKKCKLTIKDVFEQEIFSNEPYRFGRNIFEAVKTGEQTKVWRYYILKRFVVFSVDSTLKTPLTWACIRGYASIAKMLIDMGVLINKKDILGHSALFYSIYHKNQECLKLLLLNSALIQKQDLELAKQDKRMKTVIQFSQSIMGSIRKMPFQKRSQFFESRLKHIT